MPNYCGITAGVRKIRDAKWIWLCVHHKPGNCNRRRTFEYIGNKHNKAVFPAEQARIVRLLVEKVIVSPTELEVRLRANGLEKMVLELQVEHSQVKLEEVAA